MRWLRPLGPLMLVLAASCSGGGQTVDERARYLEARLVAPCCWTQTLDTHASPTVTELRDEIRRRLEAGEGVAAIEGDIVQRYGERIRAVPPGWSLDRVIGWPAYSVIGLAGVGLLLVARRWVRRGRTVVASGPEPPPAAPSSDELEDRLDRELADLD